MAGQPGSALSVILRLEIVFGCLVALLAGSLSQTTPSRHDNIVWPLGGFSIIFAGGLSFLLGRSGRRQLAVICAVTGLGAGSAIGLPSLAVPAYPTTYAVPSVAYDAATIARGRNVFARNAKPVMARRGGEMVRQQRISNRLQPTLRHRIPAIIRWATCIGGSARDTGARIIKGASGTRMGLWLAAALSELAASGSVLELPAVQLRDEFLRRCSALLDETEHQPFHWRNPTRRGALRIFDEAKAFIESALRSEYVPTVMEIGANVRVSARTLEYAFDHVVAVSPSRYLQCLRLCCARRDLKNGVEMSVTAVAMKWGFWHLGRFSIAYREMFGELPSQSHKSSKKLFLELHAVPNGFRKTDSRDGSASLT